MKITFEFPEVLAVSSCALFCSSQITLGWVFLSLGVIGSVFRAGIKAQEKNLKEEKEKESIEGIVNAVASILQHPKKEHLD